MIAPTDSVPQVAGFFHQPTGSVCYVVADPGSRRAAIIDPVLDFDHAAGRTATAFADRLCRHVEATRLSVEWILETHVHADHLSAVDYLKGRLGAKTGIGEQVQAVQRCFAGLYNFPLPDGSVFDRLFADGERFAIGELAVTVLHTPGHTPACVSYLIGDSVFCGDTLFMPDYGTARCDFPGGSAEALFRSIRRLLDLPPATRIYCGHDYPPGGRGPAWQSTVAQQRASNKHVRDGVAEADFARMRRARDATLSMPALIWPSIQVNIRAGRLPAAEGNGIAYLRLPLNAPI